MSEPIASASTSTTSSFPPVSTSRWRRLSHPPLPRRLPSLPTVPSLRTALLSYLETAETAIRDRLSVSTSIPSGLADFVESPTNVGYFDTSSSETDGEGSIFTSDEIAGSTTARESFTSSGGLRNRMGRSVSTETDHQTLLGNVLSLKEDVLAYLPGKLSMPSQMTVPQEWLKTLPHKLSSLDLSLGYYLPSAPMDYGKGKGKETPPDQDGGAGAVENARRKVITLVHALFPSEEWAGWERLGWEETDLHPSRPSRPTPRRVYTDNIGAGYRVKETFDFDDEDSEHEEPEYLFPNRTPASAQAAQRRRRTIRSKSVGTVHRPHWLGEDFPTLTRVRTGPPILGDPDTKDILGDDTEEDGLEEQVLDLDEVDVVEADMGPSVSEALRRAEGGKKMIEYEDLPFVWRNNEHIIKGYRFIPLQSTTGPIPLLKSAFWWSNETVNIHSHSIPTMVICCIIPLIIYSSPLPNALPLDTAVLVAYLLAAASCLSTSAGWHVLSGCAAKNWFEWGACVDYVGISWLIALTFETILYDAYYCHPKTILFYSFTNLACGGLGSYLPFQHWFNERRNKNWRISFFLFLCFAMFAPMVQLVAMYGWSSASGFLSQYWISVLSYIAGLIFYAFHFPECVWPGKFDFWGASHQIWHGAIVLAIILHYQAIFIGHQKRYAYSCAADNAGMPIAEVL